MNKGDLINILAEKTSQSKADASRFLDAFIETVQTAVAAGDPVSLVGFGTFKQSVRAARKGRNPKTGETINIAASVSPKFTAGAGFKTRVQPKAEPAAPKKKK